MKSSAPASAAARHSRVVGPRIAEPHVVGDACTEERGALRKPGEQLAPRPRVAGRKVERADPDPSGRRLDELQQQRCDRALSGPARADQCHRLTRGELQVDCIEHRAGSRRIGERDRLEPHGRQLGARRRSGSGFRRRRELDEVEQPARRSASVRGQRGTALQGSAAGGTAPVRAANTVRAGLEADPAAHQPDADRDGDERDPHVAASSSTALERNATRSVFIVVRR